uniref:Uncharacterized protein n=1 Tax=viral metagenome TaxID=1070528 RepID=A0A6M3LH26_9ZZZZ
MERLIDKLTEYLATARGREVNLRDIRAFLKIEAGSKDDTNLRTQMSTTLTKNKVVKPSGKQDGTYKVLLPITPITTVTNRNTPALDFRFPRNYGQDEGSFGFEEFVEIFPGDLILITGRSNYGKTIMALSLMAENLGILKAVVMGSEYTASDTELSPKFERRIKRMTWANLINDDGTLNFVLLPVGGDYEDYIVPGCSNVIDWISLNGEYYLIDRVTKQMKDSVGNGVVIAVTQKNKDAEFGEGGERSTRYVDLELKIDSFGKNESMVTIGKIKSPLKRGTGRTWAFGVTDYGANFCDIREIVKCHTCYGSGWMKAGTGKKPCITCDRTGYVNKEVL